MDKEKLKHYQQFVDEILLRKADPQKAAEMFGISPTQQDSQEAQGKRRPLTDKELMIQRSIVESLLG